jgi:hypothetical protein
MNDELLGSSGCCFNSVNLKKKATQRGTSGIKLDNKHIRKTVRNTRKQRNFEPNLETINRQGTGNRFTEHMFPDNRNLLTS